MSEKGTGTAILTREMWNYKTKWTVRICDDCGQPGGIGKVLSFSAVAAAGEADRSGSRFFGEACQTTQTRQLTTAPTPLCPMGSYFFTSCSMFTLAMTWLLTETKGRQYFIDTNHSGQTDLYSLLSSDPFELANL